MGSSAQPSTRELAPTAVEDDRIVFRLGDPDHEHKVVRLWSTVHLGRNLDLAEVDGGWELRLGRPDLDCLEYLFEVDGELVPDPGNPERVDGAFGPHSWLPMPGYRPPHWLATDPVPSVRTEVADGIVVWQPEGHDELPLLLVHDGPEMDEYGGVTRYAGSLPPMRVALLAPGARAERYSASPAYAAELVGEVLPAITKAFPTRHKPVLLGQSLGALAALHAAWSSPGVFAGLMLQSGSFFTPRLDPQESGFGYFDQVSGFVATVLAARKAAPRPPYVAMTCGTAEENLANNLAMRDQLRAVGMDVSWGEVRQGHTWTCWRDSLDPQLADLLTRVWR
jgi:enterochelin esterase-like enzyme